MGTKIFIFIMTFSLLLSQRAAAQSHSELQALPEEGSQYLQLWYEQVEWLKLHPIPVNTASIGELLQIPGFTEEQARLLIHYRKQRGPFQTKSAIQKALQLSTDEWHWLAPFFRINRGKPQSQSTLRLRLGPALGKFPTPTQSSTYHRLLWTERHGISGGILLNRRPGRDNFTSHVAGFLDIPINRSVRLFCGDYFLHFGQGLIFNLPYSFGKSQSPNQLPDMRGKAIRGDLSSLQGYFLQGSALQVQQTYWKGILFVSKSHWQATLDSLTGTAHLLSAQNISPFQVEEQLSGAHFQVHFKHGHFGGTTFRSRFSHPITGLKNETPLRHMWLWGINGHLTFSRFSLSGEWAQSRRRQPSFLLTGAIRLVQIEWVWMLRHFGVDFWNPHASVFGEKGYPTNERGLYAGFVLHISRHSRLEAFLDQFEFPGYPQQLTNSSGWEWRFRWTQHWNRKIQTLLTFAQKQKDNKRQVLREGWDVVPIQMPLTSQKLRLFWWMSPETHFRLKGQLQLINTQWNPVAGYSSTKRQGFLFGQELRWKIAPSFSLTSGWLLFQTDHYNSRLYTYEPGLPGTFSVFLAYGTGSQFYLLPQLFWKNRGTLTLKYALQNRVLKPGVNYRTAPPEPQRQIFSFQFDFRF